MNSSKWLYLILIRFGFIKGCGTELNLLRLRQRVHDIKKVKNYFPKYLLFIDLKNA